MYLQEMDYDIAMIFKSFQVENLCDILTVSKIA